MIVRPRQGQAVRVHYRAQSQPYMPHEGRIGTVRIVTTTGRPRNHGVEIDGELVVVPCGNIGKAEWGNRGNTNTPLSDAPAKG